MSIEFSRNLIKGKIAEVVFEQMIRGEGKYTVVPFGYEHTMPTLAQYRDMVEVQAVIENVSDAPDFALISNDRSKVYLVEVKYQQKMDMGKIKHFAQALYDRWSYAWLFVATSEGFYASMCDWIIRDGTINPLSDSWVNNENQKEFLALLKEFEC